MTEAQTTFNLKQTSKQSDLERRRQLGQVIGYVPPYCYLGLEVLQADPTMNYSLMV